MYARIHTAFTERTFTMVGALLIGAELLFALLLLLFGDLEAHWHVALYQLLGAGMIALAIRRHEAEQSGDRFLIMAGSLAAAFFLYTFAMPLGALAIVVWGLVFLISFVA